MGNDRRGKVLDSITAAFGIDDANENRDILVTDFWTDGHTTVRNAVSIWEGLNYPIFCTARNMDDSTIEGIRSDSKSYFGKAHDVAVPIRKPRRLLKLCGRQVFWHYNISERADVLHADIEYLDREEP
ncbi:MAG: hypothetical protein ABJ214_20340 [Roseobacter sp.]